MLVWCGGGFKKNVTFQLSLLQVRSLKILQSFFLMWIEDKLLSVDPNLHAIFMLFILPFRGHFRLPSFNFRHVLLARGKNIFVIALFLIMYALIFLLIVFYFILSYYDCVLG